MTHPGTVKGPLGTQVQRGRDGLELAAHRLRIRVVSGPDAGCSAEVKGTRLTVGVGPENDLVLADPTVSRKHCDIHAEDQGYVLRDLDSTNGTMVGATFVREAVLLGGAHFRVGDDVLVFE